MRSMEKKIYLGLAICFLVMSVGVSFAYFTSSTKFEGSGGSTNAKTAELLDIEYNAGDETLNLGDNAVPGTGKEKSFTITVKPAGSIKNVTYAIKLDITSNNFVKCTKGTDGNYDAVTNDCLENAQELVYTLTEVNDAGDVIGDPYTGDLLGITGGSVELAKITKTGITEETPYKYRLNITYKNTNHDQNHNADKTFIGNVKVEYATAD